MRGADPQTRPALNRGERLFLHATVGSVIDRTGNFRPIDALGLAVEFEFDLVVGNVAHHTFGIVEAFAVLLQDRDHIVGEVLTTHFVPLSGDGAVQLAESDRSNLCDRQLELFTTETFRAGETEAGIGAVDVECTDGEYR